MMYDPDFKRNESVARIEGAPKSITYGKASRALFESICKSQPFDRYGQRQVISSVIEADEFLDKTLEDLRSLVYHEFENHFVKPEPESIMDLNRRFSNYMDSQSEDSVDSSSFMKGNVSSKDGTMDFGEIEEGGIPHGKGRMFTQDGVVSDDERKHRVSYEKPPTVLPLKKSFGL